MYSGRSGATILHRWARSKLHRRVIPLPPPVPYFYTTTSPTSSPECVRREEDERNKEKNSAPPPIRISLTDLAGRGVFATRPIRAGDLIHTAKPLVAHPSPAFLHKVCYYCLRRIVGEGNTLTTSNASGHHFCSERCKEHSKVFYEVERRVNWSAYDDHCKVQGLKYPFLVKRLTCMVISGAMSADNLDILQPAIIFPGMIREMEEEYELLRYTLMEAQIENELMMFLTKNWYIGVLTRIRINAFRIELIELSYEDLQLSAAAAVASEAAVGNAVYMLPSFYNHDCDPNTHIVWIENADAKLKALRDIEAGEELRICYIDTSMDRDARQALLSEGFGFQCACIRCMSGD